MAITVAMRTEVAQNYVALFGRAPDADGLSYWVQQLGVEGKTPAQVAQAMYDTTPARAYFPGWMTNDEIVGSFYTNVRGRAADAEGLAYWSGRLAASSQGAVIREMIDAVVSWVPTGGANDAAGATSKALLTNKVAVAEYWGTTVGTVAGSNTVLASVTATTDTSSTAAIQAVVTASSATAVTGQTFTLTTAADSFTGTTGNDTFSGVIDSTTGTLTGVDSVAGGAGTDTLSVRISNVATGDTVAPSISAIEVLTLDNDETTAKEYLTFNTGSASGITNINSSGSSAGSQTSVTNVAASATIGLTSTKGQFAVDFASTVFATSADSIAVNLNGAGVATATGTALTLLLDGGYTAGTAVGTVDNTLETLTITSNTAASKVDMWGGSAVKTLNISGDAALTLTDTNNNFGSITTVNASTMTAALDIDLSSNTKNVTITTNTGNDRVKIGAIGTGLTADDTINLGSGTDTVAVSDTSFDATDLLLIRNELSTVETLEFYSELTNTATYDLADISTISSFKLSGTGAGSAAATASASTVLLAITGVEAGDTLTFSKSYTGSLGAAASGSAVASANDGGVAISLTPDVDGGSDSITITLSGGVTLAGGQGGAAGGGVSGTGSTMGDGGAAISASGFEVVNIVSSGTSANAIAGGTAGVTGVSGDVAGSAGPSIIVNTNGTINVSGSIALNLGTIQGTNASVNASAFTAALTVTGEAGNNTIVGGSAADAITGGAGIDTLTGNGGADVFKFQLGTASTASHSSYMNAASATSTGVLSVDAITDYAKGSDSIVILNTSGTAVTLSSSDVVTNSSATVGTAAISSSAIASFASADDTLYERVIAVESAIQTGTAAANQFAIFEFSGSTYLFVSDGTDQVDRGDVLVKLTGVTDVSGIGFSSGGLVMS